MTARYNEIKRLREESLLGNAASRHLLAISYMDDYAEVCMNATLNSIYVAFYKLALSALSNLNSSGFNSIIDSFKEKPGVKQMGVIEAQILSEASSRGVEFQRNLYKTFRRIYAAIASNIDKIIEDKWGKELTSSLKLCSSFKTFKDNPEFKTLASSLNTLAGLIKKTDFKKIGIKELKENARSGYEVSQIVLDCMNRDNTANREQSSKTTELESITPYILLISLDSSHPEIQAEGNIHYFEYLDLTKDIFKEISFNFADYLSVDELQVNVITDFAKEDSVTYNEMINSAKEIIDTLLCDINPSGDVLFGFPENYIKWLVYHNNSEFKQIGEALKSGDLEVHLNLKELFNEYLRSKIRRYISDVLKESEDIELFSILDRNISESAFVESVKSIRSGLRYCEWNSAEYDYIIANSYLEGIGVEKDIHKGISRLRSASEGGYAPAQYLMGAFLRYGIHIECDKPEAIKQLTSASEQHNPMALYDLGQMYLSGEGMECRDEKMAAKLFAEAESIDYEKARIALAECYLDGIGVEQSNSKYAELVSKFNDSNTGYALSLLADAYYKGIGMREDKEIGRKLYIKAAEAGDVKSQKILGDIYLNGIDIAVNHELAKKWYKLAADAGDPDAQYAMVQIGHALNDDIICTKYIVKAIANGNKVALTDNAVKLFPKEIRDNWSNLI